ncbi:hypothetical protein LOTGIDRAFT_231775 [Lottia gigantea]|uniref:RING-type domain-containing protein n=1 Tax=Lottia gigantea TaxID=225164 RepID=V4AQE3_LOTGI|nr:hypothetical protein LOTGIDRAFT_231775 [Lottia gigantea]ESO97035.1 hypothetical protein LOTGIDRAFT_231775 [Lottia gigantea]
MAEANIPETNPDTNSENTMEEEDNAMQKFLEKSRSELMYELRRIQHGDRPVTGQGRKEQVDQFFAKRIQASASAENVPSNVDNVEEHRPEAVVVEVQGLYEQHRVSQMLQSQQFRRQLENIIRGNITTAPRQQPVPQPRRRAQPRDSAPPISEREDNSDDDSDAEYLSADEESPSASPRTEARPQPPTTAVQQSTNRDNTSPRSSSPAVARASATRADVQSAMNSPIYDIRSISQTHQNDLIDDIRELVHQGIVSSTLEGAFRTTLEVTMQNRVPENGAEVAEIIRSLEPTGIRRNDFRILGIGNPADDVSDDISVTSFTAQAVPYDHSNLKLSRELSKLRSEMEEMKNMLKLSFELQTDIQRAIRQEVAAAINNAQGASAIPVSTPSRPVMDDKCVICVDNFSDVVLYQCGHICLCFKCGKDLQRRGLNCPVCRAPIKDLIKAYRCNKVS